MRFRSPSAQRGSSSQARTPNPKDVQLQCASGCIALCSKISWGEPELEPVCETRPCFADGQESRRLATQTCCPGRPLYRSLHMLWASCPLQETPGNRLENEVPGQIIREGQLLCRKMCFCESKICSTAPTFLFYAIALKRARGTRCALQSVCRPAPTAWRAPLLPQDATHQNTGCHRPLGAHHLPGCAAVDVCSFFSHHACKNDLI